MLDLAHLRVGSATTWPRGCSTLSDREEEVLQQLHEGVGVRAIAEQSEVAEATVRSQVKSILRKLEVSSQMAAVLAYEELVTDSIDPDLYRAG